jgi:hypothetical protein
MALMWLQKKFIKSLRPNCKHQRLVIILRNNHAITKKELTIQRCIVIIGSSSRVVVKQAILQEIVGV